MLDIHHLNFLPQGFNALPQDKNVDWHKKIWYVTLHVQENLVLSDTVLVKDLTSPDPTTQEFRLL